MAMQSSMSKAQRKKAKKKNRRAGSSHGAAGVTGHAESQPPEAGSSGSNSHTDERASISRLFNIAEEGAEDMQESGNGGISGEIFTKPITRNQRARTTSVEIDGEGVSTIHRRRTLSTPGNTGSDRQDDSSFISGTSIATPAIPATPASQVTDNTVPNSPMSSESNEYMPFSDSPSSSMDQSDVKSSVPDELHLGGHGNTISIKLYFFRLNVALLTVLLQVVTSISPGNNNPDESNAVSFLGTVNSILTYFPPIIFSVFNFGRLAQYFSGLSDSLKDLPPRVPFVNVLCTPALVLTIQMAISFEGLPVWATWVLFACSVTTSAVACFLALKEKLLQKFEASKFSQEYAGFYIVYGSLACVSYFNLEMQPSFVHWFSTKAEGSFTFNSIWYTVASMGFSLAIIIQLPALFLEALFVEFYKFPQVPDRREEQKRWSSVLLAALFHLSFSSFMTGVWSLMVAEAIPMFIVFTWMLWAPVVVLGIGCYRHGLIEKNILQHKPMLPT